MWQLSAGRKELRDSRSTAAGSFEAEERKKNEIPCSRRWLGGKKPAEATYLADCSRRGKRHGKDPGKDGSRDCKGKNREERVSVRDSKGERVLRTKNRPAKEERAGRGKGEGGKAGNCSPRNCVGKIRPLGEGIAGDRAGGEKEGEKIKAHKETTVLGRKRGKT